MKKPDKKEIEEGKENCIKKKKRKFR
jgi:hypothetical protein